MKESSLYQIKFQPSHNFPLQTILFTPYVIKLLLLNIVNHQNTVSLTNAILDEFPRWLFYYDSLYFSASKLGISCLLSKECDSLSISNGSKKVCKKLYLVLFFQFHKELYFHRLHSRLILKNI